MSKFTLALAATLALTAGIADAQTFRAENRVTVTGQGDGLFSVPSGSRYGARGAWCAAADYAMDVLNARGNDRLYVRSPQTTNSGPVTFGLTPGNTTPTSVLGVSAALRDAGASLSVDHAFQFCYDTRLINSR